MRIFAMPVLFICGSCVKEDWNAQDFDLRGDIVLKAI